MSDFLAISGGGDSAAVADSSGPVVVVNNPAVSGPTTPAAEAPKPGPPSEINTAPPAAAGSNATRWLIFGAVVLVLVGLGWWLWKKAK